MPSETAVDDISVEPEMSQYYKNKLAEVEQWRPIRDTIQKAASDTASPACTTCQLCMNTAALLLKCYNCGVFYFGCEVCVVNDHQHRPLHLLEMWKVNVLNLYLS